MLAFVTAPLIGQLQPGVLYEVYEDQTDDTDGKTKDGKARHFESFEPFLAFEEELFSRKTHCVLLTRDDFSPTSQYHGLPPELPPEA